MIQGTSVNSNWGGGPGGVVVVVADDDVEGKKSSIPSKLVYSYHIL